MADEIFIRGSPDHRATCSHTRFGATVHLRWFPRLVEGSAPHPYETQVLRQLHECVECGMTEWQDIPTEKPS